MIIQLLEVDVSRRKRFWKEIFSAICHLSNGFNDKIFKKTEKSWQDGSLGKDACDSMVQAWSFVWSVSVFLCLFLRVCVSLPLCVSLLSVSHSKRKTKKDTESLKAVHSIKTIKMDSLVQHSPSYPALWGLFVGYLITLCKKCLLIGSVKSWMANS